MSLLLKKYIGVLLNVLWFQAKGLGQIYQHAWYIFEYIWIVFIWTYLDIFVNCSNLPRWPQAREVIRPWLPWLPAHRLVLLVNSLNKQTNCQQFGQMPGQMRRFRNVCILRTAGRGCGCNYRELAETVDQGLKTRETVGIKRETGKWPASICQRLVNRLSAGAILIIDSQNILGRQILRKSLFYNLAISLLRNHCSMDIVHVPTSLAFDYTWRDYLLAVNHQIDGTRTDLARRSVANYVHKSLQRDVSTV